MKTRRSSRPRIAVAAAGSVLALAACGSAAKPSPTATSVNSRLAFAKCMRSHGLPRFPDGPNIPGAVADSPAFKPAAQLCRKYLYAGSGPPGKVSASTREALLHHAQCMRVHGVPNYPDPTIPSHGPPNTQLPPGVDTNAPAFKRAASACGGP